MPKSKRSKVISLTKTGKKPGRENNERLFTKIRECVDEHQTCFVFSVDNMRNTHLKEVRSDLSDSRLFFGKTKVMAKALGTTPAEEYREGLSQLSSHLVGNVGLLFTPRPAQEIIEYIQTFVKADYARMNCIAPLTFVVPEGTVYSMGGQISAEEDVPLAHSLESTVRALGMPTRLVQGKVHLDQPYTVCKEGQKLDSKQANLLKHFGCAVAKFHVKPVAYWTSSDGKVTEYDAMEE
jgi:mRNA turnover protein 4